MMARLKTLPEGPRGGARPSPARTVRRPVKSGNERDPAPQLPAGPSLWGGCRANCGDCRRQGGGRWGYGRSVCPETRGPHAGYRGPDRGFPTPKGGGNP